MTRDENQEPLPQGPKDPATLFGSTAGSFHLPAYNHRRALECGVFALPECLVVWGEGDIEKTTVIPCEASGCSAAALEGFTKEVARQRAAGACVRSAPLDEKDEWVAASYKARSGDVQLLVGPGLTATQVLELANAAQRAVEPGEKPLAIRLGVAEPEPGFTCSD